MFIKKLPAHEQSLLLASFHITTYKRVVEELVYNALDAESTSIAIRIDIEQTSIQVIDNGNGITKNDLGVMGLRHMTSKYDDKSHSKSVSNKYGFRGESLANVVEVSKTVRIISRHEGSDTTCEKCFHNGKSKAIAEVDRRPSKGTTVEIKGFLYNLKIQTKSVNQTNELQKIKLFLESIALVHSNVSLSLRDDSENEIIFQLRKNRNIYQTISHLYDIDKTDIQELKVEKNKYSVTAFIAKQFKENNKEWIFLNRKYVNSTCRLYKIVNDNLNKNLNNKYQRKKSKIMYDDEETFLLKNKLPCYFLYIMCPPTDYDVIDKEIEFNNWDQINKLLERLVKFYINDINLKYATNTKSEKEKKIVNEGTRKKVERIMNKILASNSYMLQVSQIQKGIKGKITKRKHAKKRNTDLNIFLQNKLNTERNNQFGNDTNYAFANPTEKNNMQSNLMMQESVNKKQKGNNKVYKELYITKNKSVTNNYESIVNNDHTCGSLHIPLKESARPTCKGTHTGSKTKSKKDVTNNNFIIRRFVNPTDSVMKRCEILEQKAEDVINNFNKRIYAAFVDKGVQCSYKDEHYKQNVYKYTDSIHHYIKHSNKTKRDIEIKYNNIKSNYDLLKTIMTAQPNKGKTRTNQSKSVVSKDKSTNKEYKSHYTSSKVMNTGPIISKLTYQSHNYEIIRSNNLKLNKSIHSKFISKNSKDNCITIADSINKAKIFQTKSNYKKHLKERRQTFMNNTTLINDNNTATCSAMQNIEEYSAIEWPKGFTIINNEMNTIEDVNVALTNLTINTDYQTENRSIFIQNTYQNISDGIDLNKTYNLSTNHTRNDALSMLYLQENIHYKTVCHHNYNDNDTNVERSVCIINEGSNGTCGLKICNEKDDPQTVYIPDSHNSSKSKTLETKYAPIDVCEAIYLSGLFENDFQTSFNNNLKDQPCIDANANSLYVVDKDNETCNTQHSIENTSHHFNNANGIKDCLRANIEPNDKANTNTLCDTKQTNDVVLDNLNKNQLFDIYHNERCETIYLNSFDLNHRVNFIPKGMSPIFKNCNTKQACRYDLDKDYYENSIYFNFLNDVQANSDIFREQIQNIRNDQTKNKSTKMNNDLLNFDGNSLKYVKVLNQVDNKFIAAIMKNSRKHNEETSNFLVLFDQHAVHERIRLENNLSEYITDGHWKSVSIDDMTIILPKDEIIYLHNYKEKISKFGLEWSISANNQIAITAIPEAIMGKNPRQADKIMKAVKNLITEQINNIKSQNGCISVYPKSIMDLVFSEACRYAVMFGDKLSKDYCEELLKDLSKCKKPFQCAHGRPVMAVLMDFEFSKKEYKADLSKLKHFR